MNHETTSDTPETDGKMKRICGNWNNAGDRVQDFVLAELARKLERERDEARAQLREERQLHVQTLDERDEARQSAEQWRAVAAKYAGCTENECNRLPWEAPWDSLHNTPTSGEIPNLINQ